MPVRPKVLFSGRMPKRGCDLAECEDQLAYAGVRFAVADGAAEASYSQRWAQVLVDTFCRHGSPADERRPYDDWIADCRTQWQDWEGELAGRDLPWFTREKLLTGSHSTFIGLVFDLDAEDTTWTVHACGDACVFVVRDDHLLLSFPCTSGAAFGNRPVLVPTTGDIDQRFRSLSWKADAGDRFYLATDALAQWFLECHERGDKPWVALNGVRTPDAMAVLVSDARDTGVLRNDDVALLAVEAVAGE